MPKPHRHDVLLYTFSPVVSLQSETLPDRIHSTVEEAATLSNNSIDDTDAQGLTLVDESR